VIVDQVRAHLDAEALARDALAFVDVPSETGDEGAGSDFLAELLRREGFAGVEIDEVEPGRPNVYARVPGAGSGRSLVLNGHVDTIPVGQCPRAGRDGDWLVGRGTEDMKSGLVAMVHGAAALRRAGIDLDGDLWLTGVVGHETPVGHKEGPRRLIQHLRSGRIAADGILIAEGPSAIWAASLGSAMFTIRGTSGREPVHSLKVAYEENPARWLGELLVELARLEEEFEAGQHHPLCGRQQLNVGLVRAGDWFNRLPVEFEVTGTRRWTPGLTRDDVVAHLEAACQRAAGEAGLRFAVELSNDREPFATPVDHPLVQALRSASAASAGEPAEIIGMALTGDANLYANEAAMPVAYYGPGYDTAHSDLERVSLASVVHCAEVYALTCAGFCGVS